MSLRLSVVSRLALAAALVPAIATAPGWTNPTFASALVAQKHHTVAHKLAPLSGAWAGSYSGSYSGTFQLTWKETGANLVGTIEISSFHNVATSIHGTVKGTTIKFGTVGSQAITYSGTVSGSSMSGSWQIAASGHVMGSGSWKASKSS
jgi:hypothetical protein